MCDLLLLITYLSAAAVAHNNNDSERVQVAPGDDVSRTMNVDEAAAAAAEVKVEVLETAAGAPPPAAGLLSPAMAAAAKPLPTANGPTWPVVTRQGHVPAPARGGGPAARLSRTLDLTTSRCVESSAATSDSGRSTHQPIADAEVRYHYSVATHRMVAR